MSKATRTPVASLPRIVDCLSAAIDDTTLAAGVAGIATDLRERGDDSVVATDRLQDGFGLSAFERDVLLLVGLPEEHEFISHAARQMHPLGEPRFSFGMIAQVLALELGDRGHLRNALQAGPLRTHALLSATANAPLPDAGHRLVAGLWDVIRGTDHWPEGCHPVEVPALSTETLDGDRFRQALTTGPRIVLVTGGGMRPPRDLAAAVAAVVDGAAAFFEAPQIGGISNTVISAHCIARGVLPVVVGQPAEFPLPTHPGPVVVCVEDVAGLPLDGRPVVTFDLGDRTLDENIDMWNGLVPELNGEASHLAGLLRVDQFRAARAVADARAALEDAESSMDVASIVAQVRRRTDITLPNSVQLVRPRTTRHALVTTPANGDLLQAVIDRVNGQVKVLHEWGFGLTRNARGVKALFSGPPGTGKTMSAETVAGSLGLDLLVVDLSVLVSKWLGETEKNISAVFDAAERCQAVLFFDEADSIFARRTDSSDAQSRWANLETAHLLGRMEAFVGLVVLATNLQANIDDAFVRRLDVIVDFDEPGFEERRQLWQAHLPTEAPLAVDVNFDQLAELYPITGGLIRNAALDAAFRAAAADHQIDQRGLILSIEREYQKAGRSFPGIPRRPAVGQPTHSVTGGA